MWNAERIHPHIADFEAGTGAENAKIEARLQLDFDGLFRQSIAVNGNVQLGGQAEQTLNVIGMFVRDQNARQTFGAASNLQQTLADLAPAQPGINEEAGFGGFEVSTIATGTAAENGQRDRHAQR
jgi:hypothetical protein